MGQNKSKINTSEGKLVFITDGSPQQLIAFYKAMRYCPEKQIYVVLSDIQNHFGAIEMFSAIEVECNNNHEVFNSGYKNITYVIGNKSYEPKEHEKIFSVALGFRRSMQMVERFPLLSANDRVFWFAPFEFPLSDVKTKTSPRVFLSKNHYLNAKTCDNQPVPEYVRISKRLRMTQMQNLESFEDVPVEQLGSEILKLLK